jgi:hypothetical protein
LPTRSVPRICAVNASSGISGAQLHDRVERSVEVEAPVLGTRAHLHRELPVAFFRHEKDE